MLCARVQRNARRCQIRRKAAGRFTTRLAEATLLYGSAMQGACKPQDDQHENDEAQRPAQTSAAVSVVAVVAASATKQHKNNKYYEKRRHNFTKS